ncbi:MAG: transcription elongation factor GreA [Alkaliphilus sp.]|nr:transcription elongation factor GreA [bacterium AH-315-L21]PHS33393.1 MAG: transcription elongation factor GreA [Alkaliphilus sp.]
MFGREVVLTKKGLSKIEGEIEHLKTVRRKEVSARIKQAIAFGDISENAEYDEAKNEQAQVEERITKLENMLKGATVIDENDIDTDVVNIGSKVVVKDVEDNEEMEYTIVGLTEADPYELKVSNESPIGRALIGKRVSDLVEIMIPDGHISYKIMDIRR